MATLHFEIKGELGSLTLLALQRVAECTLKMLADYDQGISREKGGSLDWLIINIGAGSLRVDLASQSRLEDKNFGPDVARLFVAGWESIERAGATPPYLTERGMAQAKRLAGLIGKEGTTGFLVSHLSKAVDITSSSTNHLQQLTKIRQRSIGSVEGRLETISIHGQSRIILYHSRTGKAVTCRVTADLLPKLVSTEMLGRRVIASGEVHSNVRGEPMRMNVEDLRILRRKEELPATASLGGRFPDFTGDQSTEEYLRSLRGA